MRASQIAKIMLISLLYANYTRSAEELTFKMPDKIYSLALYRAYISPINKSKIEMHKKIEALEVMWIKTPDLELANKHITTLCFFNKCGIPTIAAGTAEGDVAVWQWNSHRWVLTKLWPVHENSVVKIAYSSKGKKQFLTVTSEKNSSKTWLI